MILDVLDADAGAEADTEMADDRDTETDLEEIVVGVRESEALGVSDDDLVTAATLRLELGDAETVVE